MRALFAGSLLPILALLAPPGAAQKHPLVPFPLAGPGPELSLQAADAAALTGLDRVVLAGVPLPDGPVDVLVERVGSDPGDRELRLDGAPATPLADPLASCWRGRVLGDEHSEVFLGFSSWGSRGWVKTGGARWHLLAGPGADGGWTRAIARFAAEGELLRPGGGALRSCDARPRPGVTPAPLGGGTQALTGPSTDVLVCRMAVETDYQLYQRFNSVPAEQAYLDQLCAALSARFDQDIDVQVQVVYLGLHSTPNDGWTSGDSGAGSGAMLDEFRTAWAGSLPNGANLAHFLSGAALGGGVAYVGVLCDPYWGFAVSGDLSGATPFPVAQGPLSWDFYVFAHETGHNFGSPHTQDFCPPLDTCVSNCTGTTSCSQGTIMSYCHLCPGGSSNIQLVFHPTCAQAMRVTADASCLPVLCAGASTYCATSPNSFDPFGAYMSYVGSNRIARNDLMLVATGVPPGTSGLFFCGQNAAYAPFGNGYRCIGSPVFRLAAVPANLFGEADLQVDYNALPPGGQIGAGQTWNFQYWYRNPAGGGAGFNLTDALRMQFCP